MWVAGSPWGHIRLRDYLNSPWQTVSLSKVSQTATRLKDKRKPFALSQPKKGSEYY